MKSRERFQELRAARGHMSLRLRLVLLVSAELLVAVLVALGVYFVLKDVIPIRESTLLLIDLVVISLTVGTLVTAFLSKLFFDPIRHLLGAMARVADGDLTVRLQNKTTSREILEMYTGFNMMVQELQNTEILQSDFISNVSHELKTPINAIEGYATLLQEDGLSPQGRIYAEKILFNTQRLSSLTGSILLLSKLENQLLPRSRSRFRLDEQIRGAVAQLEPLWEKRRTRLEVELERLEYTGCEPMLHHVWENLLNNAIKFGPEEGLVRLTLRREAQQLRFTVTDRGPGIPPEALGHIFDKFYQADNSHRQEGNGLGLSLVKRIVDLEDGSVTAENLPEGGCRFTVLLPLR